MSSEIIHLSFKQKVKIYSALWDSSSKINKITRDDNGEQISIIMKLPKYLNGGVVKNLPEVNAFINQWMKINDMPLMKIVHKYRNLIHKYGYDMGEDRYPAEIYGDIMLRLVTRVVGLPYEIPYYHEQSFQMDDHCHELSRENGCKGHKAKGTKQVSI